LETMHKSMFGHCHDSTI